MCSMFSKVLRLGATYCYALFRLQSLPGAMHNHSVCAALIVHSLDRSQARTALSYCA